MLMAMPLVAAAATNSQMGSPIQPYREMISPPWKKWGQRNQCLYKRKRLSYITSPIFPPLIHHIAFGRRNSAPLQRNGDIQ